MPERVACKVSNGLKPEIPASIDVICKGGTRCSFSASTPRSRPTISPSGITTKEAQLLGTWLANASFPRAVDLLEKGVLDLAPLVTHVLPLARTAEGIEILRKGEGVKVFINPRA